ncbi:phosphoribosylformylglycinamidine synthase subunit PurL [uncultured Actinomyces sp.]|uniref:phosphoribosylformylglycinamidine synthase subunit PurL n=1 Tax=uncultured Actinomyces sp. TaxID=249061 RepID=UPI002638BB56|nr:phosphoribosylformylglycinamidine synthase subunit PurL [uncultured Actinomyces sp.]
MGAQTISNVIFENPRPSGVPDTVENAKATPNEEMPWHSLGLKEDEYNKIVELLGRRPTIAELSMYSVMWSEHCSYKSSKKHLKEQFGSKTTEEMGKNLLVGIGQNAGVVDVGDGWAVTFKVESHNHPSYVEPYEGAATGIGGCVRDIISMGARPIAVMDGLNVGDPNHPDTARVVRGAVDGLAGYGNVLGVPAIGGETTFDPSYQGNPLVNAVCAGAVRHEHVRLADAKTPGNMVVLFGARTGGDGIGGASILASESFEDDESIARPTVQVGDPYMEKQIIECLMELFDEGVIEAIQDLGAAGVSCATSELSSNGGTGMHIHLENVLLRDPTLTAGEILMSESQERMMATVAPENMDEFWRIATKWGVEGSVIGEVTDTGRLIIDHFGHRIVDVDPKTVAHDSPVYDRPYARPKWQDALQADTSEKLARPASGEEIGEQIKTIITSANGASKKWMTDQFDHYTLGNTAMAAPDDAGVVRVDASTDRGIAMAIDSNGWFTKLDPYEGAKLALAAAYRNVAAVGANPIAISDGLNFGNPEDPDAMWQLVQAMTGLADGCKQMGIPVTGGNVSLYNSSGTQMSQPDSSINPTPMVVMLGVIDDVKRARPSGWFEQGMAIYLLGDTAEELDASAWARDVHGHFGGLPPKVDLDAEMALGRVIHALVNTDGPDGQPLIHAAHDVAEGGLAQALVEMATRRGIGANIDLSAYVKAQKISDFVALFSESTGRMVVALPEGAVPALTAAAQAEGVSCTRIGLSGGTLLTISGFDQLGDAGGFDAQVLAEVSGESIPEGACQSRPLVFRVRELAEQMGAVIPGLFA